MQHNQPLISYYPEKDAKFIDPMYVPYERKLVPITSDGKCKHPINTWKRNGSKALVHPDHIRHNLGTDFLKVHPNDSCPAGWKELSNGICSRSHQQAHESSFATPDIFAARYQYHDGYSVSPKNELSKLKLKHFDVKNSETFLNRSVNPHTGKYVVYHEPRPHPSSSKYGVNPARHSYLGK